MPLPKPIVTSFVDADGTKKIKVTYPEPPTPPPKPPKLAKPPRDPSQPHHRATDPIRGRSKINRVINRVKQDPRDYALFTLGMNLAFRGSDLLALNLGDVRYKTVGDTLRVVEKKTKKVRLVALNAKVIEALETYLPTRASDPDDAPLFIGKTQGRQRLTIETFGRLVKKWCADVKLEGNFASHSLRKTFGYTLRVEHKVPIEMIQQIYGHQNTATTLTYVSIQPDEIHNAYMLGV